MNVLLLHISTLQLTNIIFVVILFFIGYRYLESFWSYKISKPHAWEKAVKNKHVSKELRKIEKKTRDKVRFYNLWFQIERIKKKQISGAFAELGVHQGQSAKSIHYMEPNRKFYLFDTFEGFPEKDLANEIQSDSRFTTEMFSDTNLNDVKDYINGNENIIFKIGFFPDTTNGLTSEKFAFVNIDADLYSPTIKALEFFYPRLTEGGVIIIHDYNHNWEGIQKALNEFMPKIPESLIELPDWQGSAMIIKNSYY